MAEMLSGLANGGTGCDLPVSAAYVSQLLYAIDGKNGGNRGSKPGLTMQEAKVLGLMAEGLVNKEIAHRMAISAETVKSHIKNVYLKLETNNQAVQRARQLNILS